MADRLRLLLVDGDADVRRSLRRMLERTNRIGVVAEVSDGTAALGHVSRHDVDVVVLGLRLPDLAGEEVLTRLRAADPGVRVIVLTGQPPEAGSDTLSGAHGIVGPDEHDRLIAMLEEFSRESRVEATVELPCESLSTRCARRFVERQLQRSGHGTLAPDAALVASELVANAIEHADSSCAVDVRLHDGVVRISVTDWGPGTPQPRAPSPDRPRGRGLGIVSALTTAWGIDPDHDGKTVWAELAI